jgi:aconitate decarboxylase
MNELAPLTRAAAEFVATLQASDIPAQARKTVSQGFGDCIGVMLAAAREPAVRIACETLLEAQGAGGSRILLGARSARATDAALINGLAAHAFDFDDIGLGAHPAHPSAVLVPAILALADALDASGEDMFTAYVAGYEVWGEIALRDRDQHHVRGWHPTGVFGPVAAAAAAARLMKLDAGRTAHALGLAASRSGGLLSNYGAMSKPLHAGLAAQSGVFSAQLAARGFTAGAAALEHERGLLRALSPHGDVDLARPVGLGRRWRIVELPLGFKQYPLCYAMHRIVDAAIDLRASLGGPAEARVRRMHATIGVDQARLLQFHAPTDALQAKFSLEFGIAAALLDGHVGLKQLDDGHVLSEPVQRLMARVETATEEARDPVYRIFSPADRLEIETVDGQRLAADVRQARGHPDHPLSTERHWRKFEDCTADAFAPADARAAFDALQDLPALRSARALPEAST